MLTTEDINAYKKLNVRGKNVLDAGAYIGDTAKLFLDWGAKTVFCVEIDPDSARKIKLPHTLVFVEKFNKKHLDLPWDVLKMDIEHYELDALPLIKDDKRSMVIEVHNFFILKQFEDAGFRRLTGIMSPAGLCIVGKNLEGD